MAIVLLTDGNGPVYRQRGPASLADGLKSAIVELDPALPLTVAA
jgi:hypothetical protein